MRDNRRTRLVLALLVLTAFTLITLDYRAHGGGVFGAFRRAANTVFGPVERAAADVVRPVRHGVEAVTSIGSNHKKLQQAQQEVAALRAQLRQRPFDQHRLDELNQLLHVSAVGQYKVVPAQVVSYGPGDGFEWTATIDVGARDGIRPEMTVVNGDGLVGRVKIVGESTSTMLLAIDPQSNVGVRLPDGSTGLVSGHGRAELSLQLIDPSARVKPGQGLVTQGSANQKPFVWGVPVGSVVTASTPLAGEVQTATVKPFVNFATLDLVGVVVQPPRTDPREALLASPVPTVTVTATATVTASPPAASSAAASRTTTSAATKPTAQPTSKPTATPPPTSTAKPTGGATSAPNPSGTTGG